jgi:hypothetical protein
MQVRIVSTWDTLLSFGVMISTQHFMLIYSNSCSNSALASSIFMLKFSFRDFLQFPVSENLKKIYVPGTDANFVSCFLFRSCRCAEMNRVGFCMWQLCFLLVLYGSWIFSCKLHCVVWAQSSYFTEREGLNRCLQNAGQAVLVVFPVLPFWGTDWGKSREPQSGYSVSLSRLELGFSHISLGIVIPRASLLRIGEGGCDVFAFI